jgi:PAS fold
VNHIVAEIEARMESGALAHSRRLLPDGRTIALSYQPVTGGGAVVIFEDVTDREKAEERAQFLATHDDLTGLPNRWMFTEAVNDAVKGGTSLRSSVRRHIHGPRPLQKHQRYARPRGGRYLAH